MNFVSYYSDLLMNAVNTHYIKGQDTPDNGACEASMSVEPHNEFEPRIYLEGNRCPWRPDDSYDERECVYGWRRKPERFFVNKEHAFPKVKTDKIEKAYELILNDVGAQPRDAVDDRIVNDVRNGTGRIIDDPSEVGGWPDLILNSKKKRTMRNVQKDDGGN